MVSPIPNDIYSDLDGVIRHPVPTLKEDDRYVPVSYVSVSFTVYRLEKE